MKRIYAFELESHVVKIGISQDVAQRMQQVAYTRKEKVINIHFTEFAPSAVARRIEQACHEAFANHRLFGEYFDITFAEACAMLDSYADEIELAAIDAAAAEVERIDVAAVEEPLKRDDVKIGEYLKRFRKGRGLTQQQIADDIGIFSQMYQRYEWDKSLPSVALIIAMSKKYGVSADYLLGLSDEPVRTEPPPADDDITEVGRAITEAIRTAVNKRLQEQREVPT